MPNEYGAMLQNAGAIGLNASTSHDNTRFFVSLPTNALELWFALESERFQVRLLRAPAILRSAPLCMHLLILLAPLHPRCAQTKPSLHAPTAAYRPQARHVRIRCHASVWPCISTHKQSCVPLGSRHMCSYLEVSLCGKMGMCDRPQSSASCTARSVWWQRSAGFALTTPAWAHT